ncbi:hypothetical protein [Nocardia sp. NPDC004604]
MRELALLQALFAERESGKTTSTMPPEIDAEVTRLGRSLSARAQALGED